MNEFEKLALFAALFTIAMWPLLTRVRFARRSMDRCVRLIDSFEHEMRSRGLAADRMAIICHDLLVTLSMTIPASAAGLSSADTKTKLTESEVSMTEDIRAFLDANSWALGHITTAVSMAMLAEFYGRPYLVRRWSNACIARFILRSEAPDGTAKIFMGTDAAVHQIGKVPGASNLVHC